MNFTEPEHYVSLISTILFVLSELLPFLPCKSNGIIDCLTLILKNTRKIEKDSNCISINTKKEEKKEDEERYDTASSKENIKEIYIFHDSYKDTSSSSDEHKNYEDYEDCYENIEEKLDSLIKIIKKRDKIDSKLKLKIKNIMEELNKY